jgi:hypothetical protein
MATSEMTKYVGVNAATAKQTAPASAGTALCHRRSPRRSELRARSIIATIAAAYGMAE